MEFCGAEMQERFMCIHISILNFTEVTRTLPHHRRRRRNVRPCGPNQTKNAGREKRFIDNGVLQRRKKLQMQRAIILIFIKTRARVKRIADAFVARLYAKRTDGPAAARDTYTQ